MWHGKCVPHKVVDFAIFLGSLRISIFTLLEETLNERGYPEISKLFPLIFGNLLWLIYALNIILNGNFEPVIPPIISFIKIFVAENVAKPLVG